MKCLGTAAKHLGTQSIFVGAPGYRTLVRQQPCVSYLYILAAASVKPVLGHITVGNNAQFKDVLKSIFERSCHSSMLHV